MFEYIKGNYEEQASDYIVVDHQGMGYRINVSANTMSELPKLHKEVKVYIHPAFKEDEAISRAPGIGQKTANRIILELKDKYKNFAFTDSAEPGAIENLREADNLFNEAVNGLLGLGYGYAEASELVEKIIQPGMSIEDILKNALMSANPLGR